MVTGYKVITIWLLTIVNDGFPGTTNPWFPIILDGEIHSEIPIGLKGPVIWRSTLGRQEPSSWCSEQ
jgi:hypothetical protein